MDYSKLSERNKNKELGTPVPPVKGIQHRRSIPLTARLDARKREQDFDRWVTMVWRWGRKERAYYVSETEGINRHWEHARKTSMESGNEFKDRHGVVHNVGVKIPALTQIIDLYFREYGHLKHFRKLTDQRPAQPHRRPAQPHKRYRQSSWW